MLGRKGQVQMEKNLLSEAADECWMSNEGNWLVQCMNGGRCPMAYYNNCGQEDSDESCYI